METIGGYLISCIKHTGTRLFDRMLAEADIDAFNGAQGRILYVLWQEDEVSISRLSARTSLANTTLTSMLDRMEANGLIVRKPSPRDRRACLIALTEKAKQLQQDYDRISQRMNQLYYRGFSETEIRQLEGYLTRVLKNLEEEERT
ncbi:MAG: MarR family transcriptional regulator [Clostridia bacterium]|nr:MarR family transcriptional regulator [Clostridia bacterium]